MDVRIRRALSVRFVGVLSAALMLAPHLAGDASAQTHPPQSLTATVLGRTVTLNWEPPINFTQPLTGYLIEAGASPGAVAVLLPLDNVLNYTVAAPNGHYYVRVRALFGATHSPPSNEVDVIVPAIPTAPTNVIATVERFTVNLTWNYGFGGSQVTGWQVHAGSAPGLSDLAIVPVPSFREILTATVAAGTYYVRVVAINESGASPPSQEIVVTTGPTICDLPSTPTGFQAIAGQERVLLRWDAWSGYLPTGYLLVGGQASGASDVTIALPRITVFDARVRSGTYHARLATYNSCGQSPFTPDIVFTVAPS